MQKERRRRAAETLASARYAARTGFRGRRIGRPLVASSWFGRGREQPLFDKPADDMTGRDMDLLDERRRIRRGMQAQIAQCGHFSAGSSGKPYDRETFLAGGADRPQDVRRTSGCRDHDQDIAGTAETEDLPFEYPV